MKYGINAPRLPSFTPATKKEKPELINFRYIALSGRGSVAIASPVDGVGLVLGSESSMASPIDLSQAIVREGVMRADGKAGFVWP